MALSSKAVCITLILLISANFSFGSVLPNHCQGGPGCANCFEPAHSHMTGDATEMENSICWPGDKNTNCGFEAGRMPDDANLIGLVVRSNSHAFSGIFVAESDVHTRPNPSGKLLSQFDSPELDGAIPIYLLNDSLLC